MSRRFCGACGTENPVEARFCMNCGAALHREQNAQPVTGPAPQAGGGTDWASIVAAILAFLTLRRMSRQARGVAVVVIFFVLFFGCPMACALLGFIVESVTHLLQGA